MSFAREKRLLLGWLALLAPLPLPFNEVLEWPVLFIYLVAVIHFLGRAEDPSRSWLDNRALNGLGLIYLPLLTIDSWQGAQRGQLVTPLLHLTLFVLAVKLFSVRQEKEKWHVLLAIFFVFVASMATSSHIAVVLYLVLAVVMALLALARLAELHMLAALGLTGEAAAPPAGKKAAVAAAAPFAGLPRPRRGALFGIAAVLLLAVPIFAALPRLAQPFLTGRGAGNLGLSRVSGFSDEVSLDFSGEIRSRRDIAMRLRYSQTIERPEDLRFKGATYDLYRDRRWVRDNDLYSELRPQQNQFTFGDQEGVGNVLVFLEPLQSTSLILPSEALGVSFPGGAPGRLYRDAGGGLILPYGGQRRQTAEYLVSLGRQPHLDGRLGDSPQNGRAALDASAVTPRMAELARTVMGDGSSAEKIRRLERHLLTEYAYTLDLGDQIEGEPVENFLFVTKAGHCEYFATAMVLLLRSQGIPARFATGFLGAEPNPLEDFHVVRQSNAHAWVEAYSEESGWQIYDPTPPAGRPGIAQTGFTLMARQVYEFFAFRFDRYVLTYGADDQGDLRQKLKTLFAGAWQRLQSFFGQGEEAAPPETAPAGPELPLAGESGPQAAESSGAGVLAIGLLALFLGGGALLLWRRRPRTATAAYLALRRQLESAELGVGAATPPLELQRLLRQLAPAAEEDITRLISLYLDEAFAGRALGPAAKEELPLLRGRLEKALRQALAARRRAAVRLDRGNGKVPIMTSTP